MVKTIRKFHSHEELRLQQLRDWQSMTIDEINDHAWQMVIEYRQMNEIEPHEPRLQRLATSVRRKSGPPEQSASA